MKPNNIVCLITDFGLSDRFTGIMKGVACSVDPGIKIYDITHEITPFDISEAAWMLSDTLPYWPAGTSFVIVVDPGVGSERKALAVKTRSQHYIFCPDNGIISRVEKSTGIREVRLIDTINNRLPGAVKSETFHGRDIFVYNAARVASGRISFESLGFLFEGSPIRLTFPDPQINEKKLTGIVTRIEEPFGNLCTNIVSDSIFNMGWQYGDKVKVSIHYGNNQVWSGKTILSKTFSIVLPGEAVIYPDSNGRVGIARNQNRMFEKGVIKAGGEAVVIITRIKSTQIAGL